MFIDQIAALPYRTVGGGRDEAIRVLLVTSRGTGRWVIPKGNIPTGMTKHSAAAMEAEEEAGVVGAVCPTPLGSYQYRKRRANGASLMVDVEVFPLAVREELPNWKESAQRERRWVSLTEAADMVNEPDLRDLFRSFATSEFRAATRSAGLIGGITKKSGISKMFGWFQRLMPRQDNFFDMFEAHVRTVVLGADALARLMQDPQHRADHIREVIEREHDADDVVRQILRAVRETFLTPFDRSAIISLAGSMDDAIDEMQAAVTAIDLYDFDDFAQEMQDIAAIIVDSSRVLAEAIPLLREVGTNGKRLHELTERLVRMEGHADDICASGIKRAYHDFGAAEPIGFTIRREILNHLERITDALEDVANAIDGIVIDHA